MRTHPALIEIMAEKHQAPISIEALRPMEKALEVLRSMGVPDPDVMQVFHAFGGYIQGFVMMERQLAFAERDREHFDDVLDQLPSMTCRAWPPRCRTWPTATSISSSISGST